MRAQFRIGATLIASAAFAVVSLATPAIASATPTPPLTELAQAQSQLQSLIAAADPAGKAALHGAVTQLLNATNPGLWSDSSDPVPPPSGDTVFTASDAALSDLKPLNHDRTVPAAALNTATNEIDAACAQVANIALQQAGMHANRHGGGSVHADQHAFDHAFRVLGQKITQEVTSIPQRTFDQAATAWLSSPASSNLNTFPQLLSGPPLTLNHKPELFYYGAEFCPYCAITRWSMVEALAQFGHFAPLALTVSYPLDFAPSTASFTFDGAQYESPQLAFAEVEACAEQESPTGCIPLQSPTPAEQQVLNQLNPQGFFPFIDLGGMWQDAAFINPPVLAGLSWQQIAADMGDPTSPVGQNLDGAAETVAAQLCVVTGEQPRQICDSTINRQFQAYVANLPNIEPTQLDQNGLIDVACPSTALCVAVDTAGGALSSDDPSAALPTWSTPQDIDGTNFLSSISCPTTGLCVAVDLNGNALTTDDPTAATPTWTAPENIDGANQIGSVSCPDATLCVAVDAVGNAIVTHDPTDPSPVWSAPQNIDGTNPLFYVSCPTTSLCVASDGAGNVATTDNPDAPTPTWTVKNIDGSSGLSVACASSSLCIAGDGTGNELITHDPSDATPSWSAPVSFDGSNTVSDVTCPTTTMCAAVDFNGNALITDNPTAATPTWTSQNLGGGFSGVGCAGTSLCAAVSGQFVYITDNPTAASPTWSGRASGGGCGGAADRAVATTHAARPSARRDRKHRRHQNRLHLRISSDLRPFRCGG